VGDITLVKTGVSMTVHDPTWEQWIDIVCTPMENLSSLLQEYVMLLNTSVELFVWVAPLTKGGEVQCISTNIE